MKSAQKNSKKKRLEGAEAVLAPISFAGFDALDKIRPQKPYRPQSLDLKIRSMRTRAEARLLHKAKSAQVPCPLVLAVGPYDIIIEKKKGKTLNRIESKKILPSTWKLAGEYLAMLHSAGIVHGDYTPANIMMIEKSEKKEESKKDNANKASLCIIDFGLGFNTHDIEDFAVDVLTMKKALKEKAAQKAFLQGYESKGDWRVLRQMKEVEKRARYQDRGG